MAPTLAAIALAHDNQMVLTVHRTPGLAELSGAIEGIDRSVIIAKGVNDKLPRSACIFALLKVSLVIAALPASGPPRGAGNALVDGIDSRNYCS